MELRAYNNSKETNSIADGQKEVFKNACTTAQGTQFPKGAMVWCELGELSFQINSALFIVLCNSFFFFLFYKLNNIK